MGLYNIIWKLTSFYLYGDIIFIWKYLIQYLNLFLGSKDAHFESWNVMKHVEFSKSELIKL